jgi:hypothetical protein
MKTFKSVMIAGVCSIAAMSSMSAFATVVAVGDLTTDTATHITTDSKTGRSYTRFDAFDLTYAQTVTAIAPGSAWAGWSIATAVVSDQFIASALGVKTTPCTGQVSYGTACGTIKNWSDGKLGASFDTSYDYYSFINSKGGEGLTEISLGGAVRDYENWSTTSLTLSDGYKGSYSINYLLYNDALTSAVPEPMTLSLFGLGLAGLCLSKRRRRA